MSPLPRVHPRLRAAARRTRLPLPPPRRGVPQPVTRVVVARADALGDFVMTLPLLAALRNDLPGVPVELVVRPDVAAVAASVGMSDTVHVWPAQRGTATAWGQARAAWRGQRLGLGPTDLVVLPRWSFDVGRILALPAASPRAQSAGFAVTGPMTSAWAPADLADRRRLHVSVDVDPRMHEIEKMRRLHAAIAVRQALPPCDYASFVGAARRTMPEQPPGSSPLVPTAGSYVAMSLTAGAAKRTWPEERFESLVHSLLTTTDHDVAVLGGPTDAHVGRRIRARLDDRLAERLHVPQPGRSLLPTLHALQGAVAFIGPDSAGVHLASLADCPVVAMTCHPSNGDPTSDNAPERFGPWATSSRIVQPAVARSPCVRECTADAPHCILDVSVDQVLHAVRDFL